MVVLEVRRGGVGLMQINAQVGLKGEFSHLGIREIVMRMKLAGALCGAVLGITVPAMAEDAPRSYVASPDIYKVIAQNGPIHVILVTWKPSQRDNWHSHPAAGVYTLTDCRTRVYFPDGTHADRSYEAGQARVNPSVASHSVENTGASECRLVIVERALVVRVDDRTVPCGDGGTRESQQSVLGPDPLAFWNSVVPRLSYTQISDPRSIALPIAMAGLLVGL